jgi:hypothetical protein
MWSENNVKKCPFFQSGKCKFGTSCKNLHTRDSDTLVPDQTSNMTTPPRTTSGFMNPQNSKICGFFLRGTCTKENCRYFHGYSENLQNIQFEKIHEKNITSLVAISENKFLSADENTIKIWIITDTEHKTLGDQSFQGEKITRVIYANEKVIAATVIEQMYEARVGR